ncbi:MAG: alpha/beta fold hydrolase [Saprospiraceae bacterium]|nr:alpha/beta fold hydrolase [Saprospiraceae bacterium]
MPTFNLKPIILWSVLIFFSLLSTIACKNDDDDGGMPIAPACDSTLTPIVFVHGFLASGDTYAAQFQRFESNDYCTGRLFAFDWNTLGTQDAAVQQLNVFIDNVLASTGSTKVNLVGHSAGGGLGYNYLSDASRAAKVGLYAHLGSGPQPGPAGPNGSVPTLNVWSDGDKVVQGNNIPGATNVQLPNLDHYQVATGTATFEALFKFFNADQLPATTDIKPDDNVVLEGRVVTLGENAPKAALRLLSMHSTPPPEIANQLPPMPFSPPTPMAIGALARPKATYYEFLCELQLQVIAPSTIIGNLSRAIISSFIFALSLLLLPWQGFCLQAYPKMTTRV